MKSKINIFFHKESKELEQFANNLFKILYRDYDSTVEKGLMIDTYFIKIDKSIDLCEYDSNFCIFLVDSKLALSDVQNIDEENSLIVSFTKHINKSKSFNTDFLYLLEEKECIELGLFTFLAKKLYSQKNLTLFLSHTKRDDIGERIAKEYNTFICNNTKLKSFIDINDISHGNNIEKEINDNLIDSIFIGFESDGYSDSNWAQLEVVVAKENNIPLVLIDCIEKRVGRRFPYLGNSLVLNNSCIEDNIKDVLIEAVRLKTSKQKMEYFNSLYNYTNTKFLNNAPELFDLQSIDEDIIIYPEPPITNVEKQILEKSGKKIYTPLTYTCQNEINKNIGISISEVNGEFDSGFENIHLYTIQEEIAKYLLYTKNKIIYGGDISYKKHFNFVKILANIADTYGKRDESIENNVCYPLNKNIDDDLKLEYSGIIKFEDFNQLDDVQLDGKMPYSHTESLIPFAKNLSLMREMMANKCDSRVMIAGKHFEYLGKYPGILEEAYYTLKAKKPLYLVGGFGGATKLIIDLKKGEEVEELTLIWQKNHNENLRTLLDNGVIVDYDEVISTVRDAELNNGLTKIENEILFTSKSIEEIIFYIMKGLNSGTIN
jgi:hypothetical protein